MDIENIMRLIKGGNNPEQLMIGLLSRMTQGNPLAQSLLSRAQNGRGADIEYIARNVLKERGKDFDTEFAAFRKQMKL